MRKRGPRPCETNARRQLAPAVAGPVAHPGPATVVGAVTYAPRPVARSKWQATGWHLRGAKNCRPQANPIQPNAE
eukprot:11165932-Lingulodinium_polyedra.AAC.1